MRATCGPRPAGVGAIDDVAEPLVFLRKLAGRSQDRVVASSPEKNLLRMRFHR